MTAIIDDDLLMIPNRNSVIIERSETPDYNMKLRQAGV